MKNLEIEYKKQIADEVPDLWSRIESSIDAIEGQNEKDNNVVEFKAPEKTSGSKIKKINSILKYSVIVASAACVLVVVLAVTRSGSNMSATAPMSDSASYDTGSAAASDSYYEEAAEAADADEAKSSKDRKKKKDSLNFSNREAASSAEAAAFFVGTSGSAPDTCRITPLRYVPSHRPSSPNHTRRSSS